MEGDGKNSGSSAAVTDTNANTGAGDTPNTGAGDTTAPAPAAKLTKKQKRALKKKQAKLAKKRAAAAAAAAAAGTTPPGGAALPSGHLTREKLFNMMRAQAGRKEEEDEAAKKHKFWDNQPVPKMDQNITDHGPLEVKTVDEVRDTPLPLLKGFEWSVIDINDSKQREEVFDLLAKNYVADDDNVFRFKYSPEFLVWALTPPGYFPDWLVGVRQTSNKRLRGFISGIPVHCHVYDKITTMCEINFLCVHKKLRSLRLAPVLIKEVTRRVNRRNIWQAVYTAGVVIPKPVGACQYWHRSLNVRKLIDIEFSRIQQRMTLNRTIKLYRLPETTSTPGFRAMTEADVPAVTALMHDYLAKFKLWVEWDEEETKHWMLPRDGVVNSFVVEDPETHKVTDVCSFYHLPSSITGHAKYKTMNAAYSFYNVATSTTLEKLVNDMLIVAKQMDFDVFNALDLMENESFLKKLKFGVGDGTLNYYLYNWGCPQIKAGDIGLVLL